MTYFLMRSLLSSKSQWYICWLPFSDLIIVKTMKYLCSASILCRLRNVLRVSISFSRIQSARNWQKRIVSFQCCCNIMVWTMCLFENLQVKVLSRVVVVFTRPNVFMCINPFANSNNLLKRILTLKISLAHFLRRSLLFSKPYLYVYLK